ncbi:MAG: DNA gyrase inhibitor GyrI [Nitrospinales bacterium]
MEETKIHAICCRECGWLLFIVKGEKFNEIAVLVWDDFLKLLEKSGQDLSESKFMGISLISEEGETDNHIYKAAVSYPPKKNLAFNSLTKEILPTSKYAIFLLKGSYQGIWKAFDFAFKKINDSKYEFSQAPCLENYINDPSITPEDELLTEILIPIK